MRSMPSMRIAGLVAIMFLVVVVVATAQQGWSRSQVINQGDKPATVNAVYYDGEEVWVVGANGLITRSYDDGRTFLELQIGVDAGLNDVFVRKDRIWIVGDNGTILVSTDGGQNFIKSLYASRGAPRDGRRSPALDLYSVQFLDERDGYIVGDQGLILQSTDGGTTWRELRSGVDSQLFHLCFRGKRGWVVGTKGTILHTDDEGKNWYPQHSGETNDLNRVYMVNDKLGLITGDNGTLLWTNNGGATWTRRDLGVREPLFGICFVDKNAGWVVGYNGRIIRTYDGGRNWVEQESGTSNDLFSVSFRKNRGYAIGRDGLIIGYYEKR